MIIRSNWNFANWIRNARRLSLLLIHFFEQYCLFMRSEVMRLSIDSYIDNFFSVIDLLIEAIKLSIADNNDSRWPWNALLQKRVLKYDSWVLCFVLHFRRNTRGSKSHRVESSAISRKLQVYFISLLPLYAHSDYVFIFHVDIHLAALSCLTKPFIQNRWMTCAVWVNLN